MERPTVIEARYVHFRNFKIPINICIANILFTTFLTMWLFTHRENKYEGRFYFIVFDANILDKKPAVKPCFQLQSRWTVIVDCQCNGITEVKVNNFVSVEFQTHVFLRLLISMTFCTRKAPHGVCKLLVFFWKKLFYWNKIFIINIPSYLVWLIV